MQYIKQHLRGNYSLFLNFIFFIAVFEIYLNKTKNNNKMFLFPKEILKTSLLFFFFFFFLNIWSFFLMLLKVIIFRLLDFSVFCFYYYYFKWQKKICICKNFPFEFRFQTNKQTKQKGRNIKLSHINP